MSILKKVMKIRTQSLIPHQMAGLDVKATFCYFCIYRPKTVYFLVSRVLLSDICDIFQHVYR